MAGITLYKMLGITKEHSEEISRRVRDSFSQSDTPEGWIGMLIEEFGIDRNSAAAFACGWFAGKYAGVSEVFNVVEKELETIEKDKEDREGLEKKYSALDGYA